MGSPRRAERDERLLRIARSVSDREPVAWKDEVGAAPGIARALEQLRHLAALAEVHRRSHPESGGSPAAGRPVPPEAADTPEPRPAGTPGVGTAWGPLQILEAVGRGGFGHVYRAFDARLDREVALKLWRRRGPDDQSRNLAEARALARLRHPNLPVVHGIDEHGGWLGMWTELVRGRTLEELLATHGPVGAREAALVGAEICRALAAIHAAGLVHRDVKTSNVMREEDGRIVLLDLGLAVRAAEPEPGERAGGTPSSMAPELLRGGRATPASDVYAVGVLLYRLVTGAFPHDASTPASIAEPPPRAEAVALGDRRSDLPATFVEIVERALSPAPESRPPGAAALEEALRELAGTAAGGVAAAITATPVPQRARLLPRFLTRFVGRDHELWDCLEAMRSHRLVTLVGSAGCGKTRLAIRAAESIAEASEISVGFADLSSLSESSIVPTELLRALAIAPAPGRDPHDHLAQAIGDRSLLLVLDNCEHLLAASGALAEDLLAACPGLRVLATSRAPLRVAGERLLEVPPLALPPDDGPLTTAAVGASDAVRLFVDRARLVNPGFRLTDDNAAAVADLCRRADGLPLAIELAAARARVLTPEEIRDRLSHEIVLLGHGGFSTTARHHSLESAIRWSYDTLPPGERQLVDALAVFAGTWTLAAASRVCLEGTDEFVALDLITNLIERSLVVTAPPTLGVSRYRFLETLRRFALEQLRDSGGLAELEERHFGFFLALAEEAEPRMWGPEQTTWAIRLDADHANFLAALVWSRARPDRAAGNLRMAGALARFWTERGHLVTGRESLQWAIENNSPDRDPAAYACALFGAAGIAVYLSDHEAARAYGMRALEIYRRLEDTAGTARTLMALGVVAHDVADYAEARRCYQGALDLYRALGEPRGIAHVLNNVGAIAWRQGEWEEARRLHREALDHVETAKDPGIRALALTNLGFVTLHLARLREAGERLTEALELTRAHRLLRHAPSCLEASAAVLSRHQESARAARLYAAAEELRMRLGSRPEPAWLRAHEPMRAAILRDLGAVRVEEEMRSGRALDAEAAIEEALRGLALAEPVRG